MSVIPSIVEVNQSKNAGEREPLPEHLDCPQVRAALELRAKFDMFRGRPFEPNKEAIDKSIKFILEEHVPAAVACTFTVTPRDDDGHAPVVFSEEFKVWMNLERDVLGRLGLLVL